MLSAQPRAHAGNTGQPARLLSKPSARVRFLSPASSSSRERRAVGSIGVIAPLSPSYAEARAAFLEAAASAGARIESFDHPLRGIDDEELFVDVAEVGPSDHANVIIVVSGTHGVEGYLGSALQRQHLETLDPDRTDGPTLIFVHALNPFGFSWNRWVNEDNVDLNRNFIDWSKPAPRNDDYRDIADTLVPRSWSDAEQERTMTDLLGKLDEVGIDRFQQVVSGGQFDHPTGLFYGGAGPTWSHTWLHQFVEQRLEGVERITILDLHTGLGPWGHGELISSEQPDSDALERQRAWWQDVTSIHDGTSVSAQLSGEWLGAVADLVPDAEVTGVAIEYGTVDPISVLQSLRADAVLHAHGDPVGPAAGAVRNQVRAAFLDDDPTWLGACWPRYRSVVTTAIERLA